MKSKKGLLTLLVAAQALLFISVIKSVAAKKPVAASKKSAPKAKTPAKPAAKPKTTTPAPAPTPAPVVQLTSSAAAETSSQPTASPTAPAQLPGGPAGPLQFCVWFGQQGPNVAASANTSSYNPYISVSPTMQTSFTSQKPYAGIWAVATTNPYPLQDFSSVGSASVATPTPSSASSPVPSPAISPYIAVVPITGQATTSGASLYTSISSSLASGSEEYLYQYKYDAAPAAIFSAVTQYVTLVSVGSGANVLVSACQSGVSAPSATIATAPLTASSNTTTSTQSATTSTGATNSAAIQLIQSKVIYVTPKIQLTSLQGNGRYLYRLDCTNADASTNLCQFLTQAVTTTGTMYVDIFNTIVFQEQADPSSTSGATLLFPLPLTLLPGIAQQIVQNLGSPVLGVTAGSLYLPS